MEIKSTFISRFIARLVSRHAMQSASRLTSRLAVAVVPFAVLMVGASTLTSCRKTVRPTAIQIVDSIRHYPATVLGDDLAMVYEVRNIGNSMLVITDIQPAVPTIEVDKDNVDMIPPGKTARLKFIFHSDKNIGLARHIIRIFGNIKPKGEAQIIFDTHVVRPSSGILDYEEYYQESVDKAKASGKDIGGIDVGSEYTTEPATNGTD